MAATEEAITITQATPENEQVQKDSGNKELIDNHPTVVSVNEARLQRIKADNEALVNSNNVAPASWVLFFTRDKEQVKSGEEQQPVGQEGHQRHHRHVRHGQPKLLHWRFKNHTLTMHESDAETAEPLVTIPIDKITAIDLVKQLGPPRVSQNFSDSSGSSGEEVFAAERKGDPEKFEYPILLHGRLEHIFALRTAARTLICGTNPLAKPSDKAACSEFALTVQKHVGHCRNVLCSCGCHQNPHYIREFYEMHESGLLGGGEFGHVCSAICRKNGQKVAVKIINTLKNQVKTHARIPKGVDHPCVVKLLDFYFTPDHVYCVMERIDKTLWDLLLNLPQNHFDERRTKFVILQVLAGLEYLHSISIVHGDLKLENILVVDDHPFPQVKISEFGYLRIIKERCFQRAVIAGSREYIPPEAFTSEPRFDKAFDMWSVGVITYVCLTGVFPYNPAGNIAEQIRENDILFPHELWANISEQAPSFITHLLNEAVWFRIRSIYNALRHDWLSQDYTSWCDMRALEVRVGAASESGTVMRYATQEEDDRRWEDPGITDELTPWEEIGCKL